MRRSQFRMIASDPRAAHLGGLFLPSSAKPFVLQSIGLGGGIQGRSGRSVGNGSSLTAAAAGRSLCAIR
jgi:hypothetical protein